MKYNHIHISQSEKETQDLGQEFARKLKPGDTVFLYGDLGFGKTTFTQGVAQGLGISSRIMSPTFTILRSHKIEDADHGITSLFHIDLYRIDSEKQLEEIGFTEILQDKNSIKFVEWPEKDTSGAISNWNVRFEMNKDNTRTINISEYE